ncbi:MAG: hypothetical protein WCF57_01695 [Pyrinomonadaceae bacterium]
MPSNKQARSTEEGKLKRGPLKSTAPNFDASSPDAHPATSIHRAGLDPGLLTPRDVLALQRAIGNRGVNKLLAGRTRRPSQSKGRTRIQRAVDFSIGDAKVKADYAPVSAFNDTQITAALNRTVQARGYERATRAFLEMAIDGVTPARRKWAAYALVLLNQNAANAPGLDVKQAAEDLIFHAEKATSVPADNPVDPYPFEREALRVSGWLELALLKNLHAPIWNVTDELYNPPIPLAPAVVGVPPAPLPLDEGILNAELPVALRNYLTATSPDPATQPAQSVDALKTVADAIFDVARRFFAPYVEASKKNVVSAGWHYSPNVKSTTAEPVADATRLSLLRNRAQLVGNSGGGGSIFARAHFNISNPLHAQKLEAIVQTLDGEVGTRQKVVWHIQQVGRTSYNPTLTVYMPPVRSGASDLAGRWQAIDTLTHELLHALAHPKFSAKANDIRHAAIVQEGFTEMLGVDLYNEVARVAGADVAFRGTMHTGIADASIAPLPHQATVDYGQAGQDALTVRARIGAKEVLAAYFLGAVDRIGL